MNALRRVRSIPPGERSRLVRAALLVATIRAGLKLVPYRVFCRLLDSVARPRRESGAPDPAYAVDSAAAIKRASRYVPDATCLAQAHALELLMRRRGLPVRLRFGVRKAGDKLEAHAWIESEGAIILGKVRGLARYRVLSRERVSTSI